MQFKLRPGLRTELATIFDATLTPLHYAKIAKRGSISAGLFSCSIGQLRQTCDSELRTLKSMFKALIASTSTVVKSNEVQSRLDGSLSALFVLGMTAIPLCVAQRRRTWAGSASLSSFCSYATRGMTDLFDGLEPH